MTFDGVAEQRDDGETATGTAVSPGVPAPLSLRPLAERPLVSVLISNKDYGRFLPQALEGLMAQTYERWEVVVCDDGSVDDSRDVTRSYAARDPRVSLVEHPVNRGQAAAFNTAFATSRGDVVCFLDADDVFRPNKLQVVVDSLRRSRAGAIVHPLIMIDGAGGEIQRIPGLTRFERGWIADRVVERGGRWRWVPTSGVAIHRDVAEVIFPMPEQGYSTSADTFILMLLPLLTPIEVADDVLAVYRRHGANHYARTGFDVARIPRTLDNLASSVAHVNERLDDLERAGPRLRVEENLQYRELGFQQALLDDGARSGDLLVRYRKLAEGLARDDLYGTLQRHWARAMYLVAIALPHRLRARWLGASLSASRPKELLRRAWVILGGR
jgi:glycosyltransferase involved in cell wall biosynthesis